MSDTSSSSSSAGIGVFGLATIVLLVFKLAGMAGVSWGLAELSWFWVFAPILFGFVFWLAIMAVVVVVALIMSR